MLTQVTAKALMRLIGSFWSSMVATKATTDSLAKGLLFNHTQSEQKVTELVMATSNLTVPAGQTTTWEQLVFDSSTYHNVTHGGDVNGKYGISYYYGEVIDNKAVYTVPTDVIAVPFLYDDVVAPTVVLTAGVDYVLTAGQLTFRQPLATDTTTYYARNVVRDTGFAYRQLGYVIDVNLSDAIFQQLPLAEYWRLYTYGPNHYNLMRLLALCANSPISTQPTEVVQTVNYLQEGTVVVTDLAVYFLPKQQTVKVAAGQVLTQGTTLGSGLEVLHPMLPDLGATVPVDWVSQGALRYGQTLARPSNVYIIKADVAGPNVLGLKYLKQVLPLDSKVLIYTNKTTAALVLPNTAFSCAVTATLAPVIDTNAAAFKNNWNINIKNQSTLRYGSYGF